MLTSLGDDVADDVRRRFLSALAKAAGDHGGTVVKSAGDGLMVAFRTSAADAVSCAVSMQRAAAGIEHDDSPLGLELRIGISSGEASHEDGDWFGTPVVEAARLESIARPGQILVSEVVRSLVGSRGGLVFRPIGKRELKGFAQPVAVVEVIWRDAATPIPVRLKKRPKQLRVLAAAILAVSVVAIGVISLVLLAGGGSDETAGAFGPVPTTEGYVPKLQPADCPDYATGADAVCQELIVPENREKPDGRQIRVGVTTYPARTDNPGVPTVTVGWFGDEYEESVVREYADNVVVDFRSGESGPSLTCPEVAAVQRQVLGARSTDRQTKQLIETAAAQCAQRLVAAGVDLDQYGLLDVANDVRDRDRQGVASD